MFGGKRLNVRKLAIAGILGALSIIFGMTPIGFIPVGPTRATIMHIPVIIGAIMEGPVVGAAIGLVFGLSSMFQAIFNPTPVSFPFLNPLISVVPRILIGITSYYVFKALRSLGNKKTMVLLNIIWLAVIGYLCHGIYSIVKNSQATWWIAVNIGLTALTIGMVFVTNKKMGDKPLDIVAATVVGTLTNTVLVLGLIYLIYAERFVRALGQDTGLAGKIILGIGVTNGIPENIVAILIVTAVVSALKKRNAPALQNCG